LFVREARRKPAPHDRNPFRLLDVFELWFRRNQSSPPHARPCTYETNAVRFNERLAIHHSALVRAVRCCRRSLSTPALCNSMSRFVRIVVAQVICRKLPDRSGSWQSPRSATAAGDDRPVPELRIPRISVATVLLLPGQDRRQNGQHVMNLCMAARMSDAHTHMIFPCRRPGHAEARRSCETNAINRALLIQIPTRSRCRCTTWNADLLHIRAGLDQEFRA
jgi:hypothetical protein